MEKTVLQDDEFFSFETDGNKWLEVRYSDDEIEISAPALSAVRLSSGETYDVSGVDKLKVRNVSGAVNLVSLQTFDRLKVGNLATDVNVMGKVAISSIDEEISVVAQATVENGTVHIISGSIADSPDMTVLATSQKKILSANPARKSVIFQVMSDTRTAVRFGGVTVAANRGLRASGDINNPAIVPMDVKGDVYAYNESGDDAKISITEVLI